MSRSRRLWIACALLFSAAVLVRAAGPFPYTWVVPEGWRTETLPMPLEFAPGLAYQGVEELRFPPGFGKPEDPFYFTYAFAWAITADSAPDVERLTKDMKPYFDGLMTAVAKSKKRTDIAVDTRVELQPDTKAREHESNDPWRLLATGTITTVDAFYTGKALTLNCRFYVPFGPPRARDRIVYFEASPKLETEAVAAALRHLRFGFKVHR